MYSYIWMLCNYHSYIVNIANEIYRLILIIVENKKTISIKRRSVLARLGTGRIHRCVKYNRGSCNAITCCALTQRFIIIINIGILINIFTLYSGTSIIRASGYPNWKSCYPNFYYPNAFSNLRLFKLLNLFLHFCEQFYDKQIYNS